MLLSAVAGVGPESRSFVLPVAAVAATVQHSLEDKGRRLLLLVTQEQAECQPAVVVMVVVMEVAIVPTTRYLLPSMSMSMANTALIQLLVHDHSLQEPCKC